MNKNFVAAAAAFALLGAASAASATTFTGSYIATANTNANAGLQISLSDTTPGNGQGFSFPLTAGGASSTLSLFKISTTEDQVDGNDTTKMPISVTFNFTAPSAQSGTVSGDTYGETDFTFNGWVENGVLDWNNGGDTTVNFGSAGLLTIHLNDVDFNSDSGSYWSDPQLGNRAGNVSATFSLKSAVSAVPEPMTWALMLTGFMGLGAALRANRRQGLALAAAK